MSIKIYGFMMEASVHLFQTACVYEWLFNYIYIYIYMYIIYIYNIYNIYIYIIYI